jgi:hypothetical protein
MSMREQLLKLLREVPFRPFSVELDNDVAYSIATADHTSVLRTILVIEDDNGAANLVSIPHITRIRIRSEDLRGPVSTDEEDSSA